MTTTKIIIKNNAGDIIARFISSDVALIAASALAVAYDEAHTVENSREVLYSVSPSGHVS